MRELKNLYEIRGDITVIFMKRKNGEKFETIISTSDLPILQELNVTWYPKWNNVAKAFYVAGTLYKDKKECIYLSRFLMNAPKGLLVDHINHNTLNNTRENLRIVTQGQNNQNKKGAYKNSISGIRGVSWNEGLKKWRVKIHSNKDIHIGLFETKEEAIQAAVEARKKYMPFSNEKSG